MDITDSVGNGVKKQIVHQLDHRGILFAGGRQGGAIHGQNGVDGIFQVSFDDVGAFDRLSDVPFRRRNEPNGTPNVLLDRIGRPHIEGVPQSDDKDPLVHTEGKCQAAESNIPGN